MNTTLVRPTLAAAWRLVLGLSIAVGLAWSYPAVAEAHGGGGGGGGHGGGMGGGSAAATWAAVSAAATWAAVSAALVVAWATWVAGTAATAAMVAMAATGSAASGLLRPRRIWTGVRSGLWRSGLWRLRSRVWLRLRRLLPGYGLAAAMATAPGSGYGYCCQRYPYSTGYAWAPGFGILVGLRQVPLQGTTSGAVSSMPLPCLGIDEEGVPDSSGAVRSR